MATFKARARALDMLGRQQIAGVPTAINELLRMRTMPMPTESRLTFIVRMDCSCSETMAWG